MDWTPTETEQSIVETARRYAQARLAPLTKEFDRAEQIPAFVPQELAELGLIGVAVDESLGGTGAGTVAYFLALQEIARGCSTTAVALSVTNMVTELIAHYGTAQQKLHYVRGLCEGRLGWGSFALSEPDAGSDPSAMRTLARRKGDQWILSGRKQWVTSGDTSGVLVVWARTSSSERLGLSCFLVDRDAPGLRALRHEDKMGLRASATVALEFEDCVLPDNAMLGEQGEGFKLAMAALNGGRIGISSQCVGIAKSAVELGKRYAQERKQFGKNLASFQAIQWMLADSYTELVAAESLALRAAFNKQRGAAYVKEASMAKVYSSEAAWRICNRMLQIHGGYGYTREYAIEKLWRDVRVTQIYEGTSEIQRLVIARALLRD